MVALSNWLLFILLMCLCHFFEFFFIFWFILYFSCLKIGINHCLRFLLLESSIYIPNLGIRSIAVGVSCFYCFEQTKVRNTCIYYMYFYLYTFFSVYVYSYEPQIHNWYMRIPICYFRVHSSICFSYL